MSANFKLDWLQKRMKREVGKWVKRKDVSLLAVSWNVDSRLTQDLDGLFHHPADLVFVGLQEVTMATEAFMVQDQLLEEQWIMAIATALGRAQPTVKYRLVESRLLVGLFGVLFVREEIGNALSQVQSTTAACGLMGMVANKGAVAIGLKVYETPLILISSHLAAHFENVKRRNQDYALIRRSVLFQERPCSPSLIESLQNLYPGGFDLNHEHGISIWLGDLNYRVALPGEEVRALVAGPWTAMLRLDQLNHEREQGRAFEDFSEAPIDFAPTYKFDRGSDLYDQSDKRRAPAWCDRILFKPDTMAKAQSYQSHAQPRCSDHRAVTALLSLSVEVIDEEAFAEIYTASLKELDLLENAAIPSTQLSPSVVDLGALRFGRPKRIYLTILNEGDAPAQFSFPLGLPSWLCATPPHGVVLGGETGEIALDLEWTRETLLSKSQIDEVLVVRIEEGKDHFVNLTGQMQRTIFHRTVDEIYSDYPAVEVDGFGLIPKFLVEALRRLRHADEIDFDQVATEEQLMSVEDAIEQDAELPNDPIAVGELLLKWLDLLHSPLLPSEYFERAMYNAHDGRLSRLMMEEVKPAAHRQVFLYLMSKLSRVPGNVDNLAFLFGIAIIRPPSDWTWSRQAEQQLNRKRIAFLRHFILNKSES